MLKLVLLLVVFVQTQFCLCQLTPHPPVPPSPNEFTQPVLWFRTGNGFQISWQDVLGRDGFFVSVCNDERGFLPVAVNVLDTSLTLQGFDRAGDHVVQVTAFVRVGENMVFNTGALTTIPVTPKDVSLREDTTEVQEPGNVEAPPADPNTPQTVEMQSEPIQSEPVTDTKVVAVAHRQTLARQFPMLNGDRSFYSPKYPFVENPMFEQTGPNGEQIPALLVDSEIDATVARIQARTQAVSDVPSSSETNKETVVAANTEKPAIHQITGTTGSSPNLEEKLKLAAEIQAKADDTKSKPAPPVSTQPMVENQPEVAPEAAPEPAPMPRAPSENNTLIWIAILVLAGFLYFIFAKEAK